MATHDQANLLKSSLERWFVSNPEAANQLIKLDLFNTTRGNKKKELSLRKLDFFCTVFARNNPIMFPKESAFDSVNLCIAYEQAKFTWKKQKLDAFKRTQRRSFNVNGKIIHSTLGQLNFFRLIFEVGAMDFVLENLDKIEQEMKVAAKAKQAKPKTERRKGKKRKSHQVCFGQTKKAKKEATTKEQNASGAKN
jgi:hypothetical protein